MNQSIDDYSFVDVLFSRMYTAHILISPLKRCMSKASLLKILKVPENCKAALFWAAFFIRLTEHFLNGLFNIQQAAQEL